MKKLSFLILVVFVFISCKTKEAQNTTPKNAEIATIKNSENSIIGNDIDKPINITKEEFKKYILNYDKYQDQWVYEGKLPCIVDFYADWCPPCKISSPILDELAKEYKGKILIYKVNVDKEVELTSLFGIANIPSFLFCPLNGTPQMFSGIGRSLEETKSMFIHYIENFLLKK